MPEVAASVPRPARALRSVARNGGRFLRPAPLRFPTSVSPQLHVLPRAPSTSRIPWPELLRRGRARLDSSLDRLRSPAHLRNIGASLAPSPRSSPRGAAHVAPAVLHPRSA